LYDQTKLGMLKVEVNVTWMIKMNGYNAIEFI
jgi:hypothetical protein